MNLRYEDNPIKLDNISIIKYRLNINKTPTKSVLNTKDRKIIYQNINLTNNTNKTNYTEKTIESSYRGNKNILIEENNLIIPYENKNIKKISKTNQGVVPNKYYSKLSIGKIEYQLTKKYKNKNNNINSEKSKTIFSKKEFLNKSSLASNNISFKEIKYNDKHQNISYIKRNNVKNYEFNGKVGQLSDNYSSSDLNLTKEFLKQDNNTTFLKLFKSNIDKIEKNYYNKKIYYRIKLKNKLLRQKSKEINKASERIDNTIKFNFIKKNFINELNLTNENSIKENKEKEGALFKKIKNYPKFKKNNRLTLNNLKALKDKINRKKINNTYDIKRIFKIQSIWKSKLYRRKFVYYQNLDKFKKIIYSIYMKKIKSIIIEILKDLANNLYTNNFYIKEKSELKSNNENNIKNIIYQESNNKNILKNSKKQINKTQYEISKLNLSLINYKTTLKEICHNNSINITTKHNSIKNNIYNLIEESQINLNTEFKGIKNKNFESFKNNIIDTKVNDINILNNKKDKSIKLNNESLNLVGRNFSLEESIDKIKESLEYDNQITFFSEIKYENIIENERFSLINNKKENKSNEKLNLSISKNENILFLSKKKPQNLKQYNTNNLYFIGKNKVYVNEITQTTDELNKIEYNQIHNIEHFSMINKKIKNYNKYNEIDNKGGLEINPIELKRTANCNICNENKIEILKKKNEIINEKAKINMMKILFPIRIKSCILINSKKYVFYLLTNKIKNICFISHLIELNEKIMNDNKKNLFEKMKKINILYYKNFYYNQISKNKIRDLLNEYIKYKREMFLSELKLLLNSIK